jgi:hypothetical protein
VPWALTACCLLACLHAMQLLERRFTKTAAYKKGKKQGPAVYCSADTTNQQIVASYLNGMRRPLRYTHGAWLANDITH